MEVADETNDDVIYEVDDGTGPDGQGLRSRLTYRFMHLCCPKPKVCAGRFTAAGTQKLSQFTGPNPAWRVRFFAEGDLDTVKVAKSGVQGNQKLTLKREADIYSIDVAPE